MGKKMEKTTEDKVLWGAGTPWKTKSEFYTYIRGCLRKAWNTHPNKLRALKASVKKVENTNESSKRRFKTVNGFDCAICGEEKLSKECVVDHIIPAGKFNCEAEILGFVKRLLFVDVSDLRIVCKDCNYTLAYAERFGIPFGEAKQRRAIIAFEKLTMNEKSAMLGGVELKGMKKAEIVELLKEKLRRMN